jgi:hypothetical protein
LSFECLRLKREKKTQWLVWEVKRTNKLNN